MVECKTGCERCYYRENTHSQVLRCHVVVQIRDNELVVDARRPSSSWSTPILNSIADRTRNVLDLVVYPHTVAGTRALEDKKKPISPGLKFDEFPAV